MAPTARDIAGYTGATLIGRGGFGAVYRATDATHGREVAIKVLPENLREADKRRFDRERQTMGLLGSHPFIIPVYESGYTEKGEGYLVMEFAGGGSLRERLDTAPLAWPEAAKVMASVAEASQAAHDHGVLHRDIKPDNILIDQFGNPKLSDFGIAAVASNATSTSSTTATLAHAAPELLQGEKTTAAIDIYAIGSTLHTLITGRPPFYRVEDDSVEQMIERSMNEPPPDLRPYGVPDVVAQVIERAMAKDPDGRYEHASELAEDLRLASVGFGSPTGPLALPPRTHTAGLPHVADPTNVGPAGVVLDGDERGQLVNAQRGSGAGRSSAPPLPPIQYQGGQGADDGGRGRVGMAAMVAVGVILLAAFGLSSYLLGRDRGVESASSPEGAMPAEVGDAETDPAGPATVPDNQPTVEVECPEEVALNVQIFCSIHTDNAVSGEWHLPAFLDAPEPIEVVPGQYEIFIEPENPSAVGKSFTITASVVSEDGLTARVNHTFTVLAVLVEIACPEEIAFNSTVICDIVTSNATEGQWEIEGFGNDDLDVVPGTNPIFIEPTDLDSVGRRYRITATATDDNGNSHTASREFTVVPAGTS